MVFESSHPFAFFDYFRIPYRVRPPHRRPGEPPLPVHRLQATEPAGGSRRCLLWLGAEGIRGRRQGERRLGRYQLGDCIFFAHVSLGTATPAELLGIGDGWRPAEPIFDQEGHHVASVWRARDGSLFLPFDPGQVMQQFWSESYRHIGWSALSAAGQAALRRSYYRIRPALPRLVQLQLRRAYAPVQARSPFPRWPLEDTLHNLYAWLITATAEIAGRPVPFLSLWPGGRSCALVLTHDVETEAGYRDIGLLRAPERDLGYRSSWNLVALRYRVDDERVHALQAEGCEVGIHGLRHDGRDLGSRRLLRKRLPVMHEYARRWDAVGFRSPATQREWAWMPQLGFEYDSSYSDTDPYEPQAGGCCTYLPYFNGPTVELPITLPQDHTIFSILRAPTADVWLRKARLLRERHGMVLVLTHPDYAREGPMAAEYRKLLGSFHGDGTVWHALPREVATWWRQRSASTIHRSGGGWAVEGPAAGAGRVEFATADGFYARNRTVSR
jgi:peptidoglycan/xylan/chitin deacetylase (PgdA/CDA1 family)